MCTFKLEAVFARHGDALLLHSDVAGKPKLILIDGGPPGVYGDYLSGRLEQLRIDRGLDQNECLPLELVLVSHIDSDHIAGILSLFDELASARNEQRPLPFKIRRLWHNSFDDIIDNEAREAVATAAAALAPQRDELEGSEAVIASVSQGRRLRRDAFKLGLLNINKPFLDLVMTDDTHSAGSVSVGGVNLTILGPSKKRVDEFRIRWKKDMVKILEKEGKAQIAAMTDTSPFNLASIVVLAEKDEHTMLLTGDARGDDIEEGLHGAGKLEENGTPFHVNLLKVPHHGSRNNVTREFFQRVTADHYVISGDGHHGNPHPEMLQMLADARQKAKYHIHFTFRADQHEIETNAKRKDSLKKVMRWINDKRPPNCRVEFRAADADSIAVDLLDRDR